jgi:hypothetical protein
MIMARMTKWTHIMVGGENSGKWWRGETENGEGEMESRPESNPHPPQPGTSI